MKNFLFFVFCVTSSLVSYGQNAFAIFQFNELDEQISWTLTDLETGEVMAGMSPISPGIPYVYPLNFEPGGYSLQITDAGGDGWVNGFFTIMQCNGQVIYSEVGPVTTSFAGAAIGINALWSCCPEPQPCEEIVVENDCPSDLNNDGLVGVGDLIIFIADFGMSCP